MSEGWVVVRDIDTERLHVVSLLTWPTRDRAAAHLDFVRASIRKSDRPHYRIAHVEVEDEP